MLLSSQNFAEMFGSMRVIECAETKFAETFGEASLPGVGERNA
jgi:hypothetical protein